MFIRDDGDIQQRSGIFVSHCQDVPLFIVLPLINLNDSSASPHIRVVALIPIDAGQISEIELIATGSLDLQCLASSDLGVCRPRSAQDNVVLFVKEVG